MRAWTARRYDTEHNTVGTVLHLHGAGAGVLVVIEVGGFLGIGTHPVAIPALDMAFMQDEAAEVHAVTNWTKEELKNMPRHEDKE
ncbi:PRC-barrel domain containing protein [Paracoccus laeviglucosivorans]|uniref:PRC-barrel domain containing protein n=1 Tax=Paracoccus laeviglucosivorans TaxID=1197861 RepID=UPI001FE8DF16|nr:PRC-barrel domain containing protein [Paracoccus laeviglucosivorans]